MILSLMLVAATTCAKVAGVNGEDDASGGGGKDGGPTTRNGAKDGSVDLPLAFDVSATRDVSPPADCVNLQCQQVACTGAPTSISGTVFAPNGKLPLYHVNVYVPNGPLEPFKAGVTCDRCGAAVSGHPIATAVTNAEGKFTLTNAPAGKDIPLVIQVGKWRRKVTIPAVTACRDNALQDHELTRLPRNRQEGDMPKIAVATGMCDQLGCLLPKIGVDPAELGVSGDDKAVTFFAGANPLMAGGGGPANMRPATDLWNSQAELSKYDLTLLSCECDETLETKSSQAFDAVTQYLNKGGRIFGSHYAYVWLRDSSDPMLAGAATVLGDFSTNAPGSPLTFETSFPKGKALADWMKFVDPKMTYGQINEVRIFPDYGGVMTPATQVWATSPTTNISVKMLPAGPRIITTNTPVGLPADKQCGRIAELDVHIAGSPDPVSPSDNFPETCAKDLTNGEEALAFLFFDLSACIQDDLKPVEPPVIP